MLHVAVVYHSAGGHTRVLAEAVAAGVDEVAGAAALLIDVEVIDWAALERADALILGCPTHMGSVSAPFKAFMDASCSRAWVTQAWKDKLAAGFTNSSGHSGDKLATLIQLAVFAAQHGMVWVSLGLMPGWNTSRGSSDDLNRLGSHLGAMAQSHADQPPELSPPVSDRRTAAHLGRRVARAALRWSGNGPLHVEAGERHPTAGHWALPPERPDLPAPLQRVNLRELAARPGRFEHHLIVVGRVGSAQLEVATASEPLPFAHANVSDEYALSLSTGDPLLESVPFITLLTADPRVAPDNDVGRVKHRVGDLVLHPYGLLHWPGRLRPPFVPPRYGPGMRRCGLSLVFCGSSETSPGPERPLGVPTDRAAAVKAYGSAEVPFLLVDVHRDPPRRLAVVGDARMDLVAAPVELAPPRGGYVVVLEGSGPHFPGDLVYLPPGSRLEGAGIERALVVWSEASDPEAPPQSWHRLPEPPLVPFEDGPRGALPLRLGPLEVTGVSEGVVRIRGPRGEAEIPRYWAARMLFRLPLHGFRLGYVETYGGLYWCDREGRYELGVRSVGAAQLDERELLPQIERLYRAIAPEGYTERLS